MTEENPASNEPLSSKTKDVLEAATGLVKACPPVYTDGLQPAVKEVGKALSTVGKAVNVALAPVALSIWGYEKIQHFLENKVAEKLEGVSCERIVSPAPNIVGPAIEGLKYCAHEESLREMFANLIANSLDQDTIDKVHPSFVTIIQSLSASEAKLLQRFTETMASYPVVDIRVVNKNDQSFITVLRNVTTFGCEILENENQVVSSHSVDNLCRLGLLEIPHDIKFNDHEKYEYFENKILKSLELSGVKENQQLELNQKKIGLTNFGVQFVESCVKEKILTTNIDTPTKRPDRK